MKLTMTCFVSLDGVMQSPGGPNEDPSDGFTQGGWQVPFFEDEEAGEFVSEVNSHADAFLLGRRTYEIFSSYWPKVTDPDNPIATKLNQAPKYVASRTLKSADWHNTTILQGDGVDAVRNLKQQEGDELHIWGSGILVQTLMRHDLIDTFRILQYPVVLSSGRRLFAEGTEPGTMHVPFGAVTSKGIVIMTYERAGELVTGSFDERL
jgi:dihydrofolate reductase